MLGWGGPPDRAGGRGRGGRADEGGGMAQASAARAKLSGRERRRSPLGRGVGVVSCPSSRGELVRVRGVLLPRRRAGPGAGAGREQFRIRVDRGPGPAGPLGRPGRQSGVGLGRGHLPRASGAPPPLAAPGSRLQARPPSAPEGPSPCAGASISADPIPAHSKGRQGRAGGGERNDAGPGLCVLSLQARAGDRGEARALFRGPGAAPPSGRLCGKSRHRRDRPWDVRICPGPAPPRRLPPRRHSCLGPARRPAAHGHQPCRPAGRGAGLRPGQHSRPGVSQRRSR